MLFIEVEYARFMKKIKQTLIWFDNIFASFLKTNIGQWYLNKGSLRPFLTIFTPIVLLLIQQIFAFLSEKNSITFFKFLRNQTTNEFILFLLTMLEFFSIEPSYLLSISLIVFLIILVTFSLLIIRATKQTNQIYKKAFLRPKEYFKTKESHLVKTYKFDFFTNNLFNIKQFLLDNRKRILLVNSNGGQGKSHLLSQVESIANKNTIVLVVNNHEYLKEALTALQANTSYILIFEDADRYIDYLSNIASFVMDNDNIKLIISYRTAGTYEIEAIINYTLKIPTELLEILTLEPWSNLDLQILFESLIKKKSMENIDLIVHQFPNPYFLVWYSNHINNNPHVSLEELQTKIQNELVENTALLLKDYALSKQKIKLLLGNIALIIPFSINQGMIFNHLSSLLSIEDLESILNKLIKGGILRHIGGSIRFNPDLIGDFYLSSYLNSLEENELNLFIMNWVEHINEKVFININHAAKYTPINSLESIFGQMITKWIHEAKDTPLDMQEKILKFIQKIVHYCPQKSYVLIKRYIEYYNEEEADRYTYLSQGSFAYIIQSLGYHANMRKELVELIRLLKRRIHSGSYDNHKPTALISDIFNPLNYRLNDLESMGEALSVFETWFENEEIQDTDLIESALKEILKADHEETTSKFATITFSWKALKDTEETRKYRDQAINVLKIMLTHTTVRVQLTALELVKSIGLTHGFREELSVPLKDKIILERNDILEYIYQSNIINKDSFVLHEKLEDILLYAFANYEGCEKALEIAESIDRSPEYFFCKLHSHNSYLNLIIEDFEQFKIDINAAENKWHFLVEYEDRAKRKTTFENIISNLLHKFDTEEKVVQLLCRVDKELNGNFRSNFDLIKSWVDSNTELFLNIFRSDESRNSIPVPFFYTIETALINYMPEYMDQLNIYIQDDELADPERIRTYIQLINVVNHEVAVKIKLYSSIILKYNNSNFNTNIMSCLFFLYKDNSIDYIEILKICQLIINNDHDFFQNDYCLYSLEEITKREHKKLEVLDKNIANLIFEKLVTVKEFSSYTITQYIELIIDNLDLYLLLIKKHITNIQKQKKYSFESYSHIANYVNTYEEFIQVMNFIIEIENSYINKEELINSIVNKENESYIHLYLNDLIQIKSPKMALIIQHLPIEKFSIEQIIHYSLYMLTNAYLDELKSFLGSLIYGSRSRSLGNNSNELINAKKLYEDIIAQTDSLELQVIVLEYKKHIEYEMKREKDDDENRFNERG